MPSGTFTNEWIAQSTKILYLGDPQPDPNSFWLCLANTTTLSRENSTADFVAAELAAEYGYTRQNIVFSEGVYDATDKRYEIPIAVAQFNAIDGSLQFQTAFLMGNALGDPGSTSGYAIAYFIESSPITLAPGQSHAYQIPLVMLNTGYANGI